MDDQEQAALKQRFEQAIETFVDKIKDDINVIAVIVGGSVAYDVVWEKSDVDLLVVVRDQPLKSEHLDVIEDGLTFSVGIMPRSHFKRGIERTVGGSFFQSYLANGRIVYSVDESLYEYFEELKHIGEDDRAQTALNLAGMLIAILHKAQKWLTVRQDRRYAQYFFLKAAEVVADLELCVRGIPTSRSAIQKALALNPQVMHTFYEVPLARQMSEVELAEGLRQLDAYIEGKMELFKRPVIKYLSDQETKTVGMIAEQLRVNDGFIIEVLNYLAEKGVIEKVAQPVKLTPKSRLAVEEIGFLYIPE